MTVTEDRPSYKWVGTRSIRPDGYDKVVGKARFAADLNLPGQLHAAILRSPHGHARILRNGDVLAREANGRLPRGLRRGRAQRRRGYLPVLVKLRGYGPVAELHRDHPGERRPTVDGVL